jgi:hypothetical protein
MTLDREAARALFGEAPAPAASGAPYAAEARPSPFATAGAAERPTGRRSRDGIDWRLVAPVGVAVTCIAAVAIFALPRNDRAVEGATVAATEVVAPPVAPAPPPVETAAVTPPAEVTPTPPAAPTVQRAAAPRPAAVRRAPSRTVAVAPSAVQSASNVSATEAAAPPPPTLGAPAAVDLTPAMPAAPPPFVEPTPTPTPEPQL